MDDSPLWLKTEIPKKKPTTIVPLESPIPPHGHHELYIQKAVKR